MNIIADDDKGPKWITNELYGQKEELQLLNGIAQEKESSSVVSRRLPLRTFAGIFLLMLLVLGITAREYHNLTTTPLFPGTKQVDGDNSTALSINDHEEEGGEKKVVESVTTAPSPVKREYHNLTTPLFPGTKKVDDNNSTALSIDNHEEEGGEKNVVVTVAPSAREYHNLTTPLFPGTKRVDANNSTALSIGNNHEEEGGEKKVVVTVAPSAREYHNLTTPRFPGTKRVDADNSTEKTVSDSNIDPKRWVRIPQSNLDYPHDLYRDSEKPSLVYRDCHGGHYPNELLYVYDHPAGGAGLNDRLSVIHQLADLASYLCATIKIKKPRLMLAPKHNQNAPVDESLHWTDFLQIQHNHPGYASKSFLSEFLKAHKELEYFSESKHAPFDNGDNVTQLVSWKGDKFDQAVHFSMTGQTFSWLLGDNLYAIRDTFKKHLQLLQQNRSLNGEQFYLPWIGGYHYVQHTISPKLVKGIQQLANEIVQEYTTNDSVVVFGSWHVRRSDGIDQCDTSLMRLKAFVKCTFGNATKDDHAAGPAMPRIVILLNTDERDPKYLGELHHIVQSVPGVELVDLSSVVRDHFASNNTLWPSSYNNNYHRFLVEKDITAQRIPMAFKFSHRRGFSCPDCYANLEHDIAEFLKT